MPTLQMIPPARPGAVMTVKVPDTAQCQNCRYLLRGLPNPICPECGHPFDPEDPDSYHDPARPKRSLLRRLIKAITPDGPHGLVDVSLIAGLTLAVVLESLWMQFIIYREPMPSLCCLIPGLPITSSLLAGVIFDFVWRVRVLVRARRTGDSRILHNFKEGRTRWRWAIACIVIWFVTTVYPWPAYLRFYASWPSLRREAQALLAGEGNRAAWRRIGLYDVEMIYGMHRGVVFFQVGHSLDMRYGFAYRPNGPPPWADAETYGQHGIRWRWVLPGWYMEAW